MNPELTQLWQAADRVQERAQTAYPEMRCRSGCNECCKHHGSPISYALEWQAIQSWLEARPEQLAGLRLRYQELKQALAQRLAQGLNPLSLSAALFEVPCPFIDNERCTIYPVRPMTCRAFGNTLLAAAPESAEEIYTCNPEKDRWEQELPMLKESGLQLGLRSELFLALEASGSPRSLLSFLERFLYESA